ncbi:MAG: hypothetical protein C4551_00930 [Bacillota bacterium]|nr:MAG: hypothetical protein C4551_00930 [Bacillota bacterium]
MFDLAGLGVTVIALGSAAVGAAHAVLPDHWVPYVVLSKARGWGMPQALGAAAAGGMAHLASTTALGVAVAFLGAEALEGVGHWAQLFGAGVLVLFGAALLARGFLTLRAGGRAHGDPHHHGRSHDDARSEGDVHSYYPGGFSFSRPTASHDRPRALSRTGRRAHILQGLLLGVRPCAEAVPMFLAAAAYGFTSSLLSVVMWTAATLVTMVLMVWISLLGLRGLPLDTVNRYGELAAGGLILLMGLGAAYLGLH